jgi:hypothetical protein
MLHAYGQSYGAPAGAYQELHSLRRLPGTLGHNQQSGLRAGGGTFHAPPAQRDEQPGAREISGIHPPEPVDHRGVRSLDLPGQRRREDFRCDPPLVGHRRNQSYFAMRPSSPSARHPGNALDAPQSNAEPKAPSCTRSAGTTSRIHPKLTAAGGSPARADGPSQGRARARPLFHFYSNRRREEGEGAAPVGGRRNITLAPTKAAGRGRTRPGRTRCLRTYFDGSGRQGGSGEPPTTKCLRSDFDGSGRQVGGGGPPQPSASGATLTGGDPPPTTPPTPPH